MKIRMLVGAVLVACSLAPGFAWATDGYFADGYGVKEQGRGGASFAVADDAMGGANNPATMAFAGNRLDVGLSFFMPWRSASRTGNTLGLNGSADSRRNLFEIPEFGYNHAIGTNWTLGVTVYGNGGMDTDYLSGQINCGHGPANLLCGSTRLGVDLEQLVVAPTATYKINSWNSIGVAPLLAAQRFKAYGLQAFSGLSSSPSNLTNNGYDYSFGYGVRIGWMGRITKTVSVGAVYSSPIFMGKFSKYKGLFAGGGGFDIPQSYGAGIAYRPIPALLLAFDYERIDYGGIRSIANSSAGTGPLGANNGPGFGWHNVNVFRLGGDYRLTPKWTLRAGYNHSDNPIQPSDVTFNILAPGVVTDHVSIGATYKITPSSEISAVYWHAFENSVSGATSPLIPNGGTDTIKLSEDNVGVAYDYRF